MDTDSRESRKHTGRVGACADQLPPKANTQKGKKKRSYKYRSQPWQCPCCQKVMIYGSRFSHLKLHTKPFRCRKCSYRSPHPILLRAHEKRRHQSNQLSKSKRLQCPKCEKNFVFKTSLKKHIQLEHLIFEQGRSLHPCSYCQKCFDNPQSLIVHYKVHESFNDHICLFCGKGYKTSQSLGIHITNHHEFDENKIHSCEICGQGFARKDRLAAHLETHKEKTTKRDSIRCTLPKCSHFDATQHGSYYQPLACDECVGFICQFCLFCFPTKRHFIAHTHNNYCVDCGIKYLDKKFYNFHMAYHNNPNSSLVCEACCFDFESSVGLKIHMRKYHGGGGPNSEKSKEGPKSQYQTMVDMLHQKEPKLLTGDGKSLSHSETNHNKQILNQCKGVSNTTTKKVLEHDPDPSGSHRRGPKRKPPQVHSCPICKKEFKRGWDLKRHINCMHTSNQENNEDQFTCDECDKKLKSKRNLELHTKTHLKMKERKTWSCPICAKKFLVPEYLKVHMKIHEQNKDFTCPVCFKTYLKAQGLKEHMASHADSEESFTYKCHICKKCFASSTSLKKHIDGFFCGVRKRQERQNVDNNVNVLKSRTKNHKKQVRGKVKAVVNKV